MEHEVQPSSANPSAMLSSLVSKRKKLQDELRAIEKQVYELETSYLHDSSQCGNVLKGFEGFLSSSKSNTNLKRSRKFQPEDRLFSLSSVTSPAAEEHLVGRDDGRSEYGQGRSKGGGTPANGHDGAGVGCVRDSVGAAGGAVTAADWVSANQAPPSSCNSSSGSQRGVAELRQPIMLILAVEGFSTSFWKDLLRGSI